MPQWTYKNKPAWYPSNKVEATPAGWAHTDTGELLVCIGGLDTSNTDAASVPTFTLTLPADDNYESGETLTFTLASSEAVKVIGYPAIKITGDGGEFMYAQYNPTTSTSTSLKFDLVLGEENLYYNGGMVEGQIEDVATSLETTYGTVHDILDGERYEAVAVTYTVGDLTGIEIGAGV